MRNIYLFWSGCIGILAVRCKPDLYSWCLYCWTSEIIWPRINFPVSVLQGFHTQEIILRPFALWNQNWLQLFRIPKIYIPIYIPKNAGSTQGTWSSDCSKAGSAGQASLYKPQLIPGLQLQQGPLTGTICTRKWDKPCSDSFSLSHRPTLLLSTWERNVTFSYWGSYFNQHTWQAYFNFILVIRIVRYFCIQKAWVLENEMNIEC